jgi:hypothetical protein
MKYIESGRGAYMHEAENGFIVEVVQLEDQEVDPATLIEPGEPPGMGEVRAQQMPKTKAPVSRVFVFDTLEKALNKLKEYFDE